MNTNICQTPTVADAIEALERYFPLSTQDSWDNSGLLVGNSHTPLRGIMLSLDITEDVVEAAVAKGCNMILSHHPIMFRGLKRLTGSDPDQRTVMRAVQNDVALVAFHTPADKGIEGTSGSLGRILGMTDLRILAPETEALCKVVTYVPTSHTQKVKEAMSEAGAGHIGNYSNCTWSTEGVGQYKALDGANPWAGTVGKLHTEPENRVEAICPRSLASSVERSIRSVHPYEEPAMETIPIADPWTERGYGVVGTIEPMSVREFLQLLKEKLACQSIRYVDFAPQSNKRALERPIGRVAICTGSGSEFIKVAQRAGADAYVTADVKYHQLAEAQGDMLVADIGHYESEIITINIFKDVLTRFLANFASYETYTGTNPIKYY
ncbi:MAG: Nif3-like dinuclear metal center hexameric protein [Bacteroidales bacterium]|nr:Nif3-like dinuclear metal center hexameric protein [Bacteroidales bacterium]MDD5815271.1 Nif3-like dinuclear metal center hexameric protein [Bacteroidales bacterium]MDY4520081.1 Nif3-like dinuclear metal center hexameric protein [Bacteroidales bacterium]